MTCWGYYDSRSFLRGSVKKHLIFLSRKFIYCHFSQTNYLISHISQKNPSEEKLFAELITNLKKKPVSITH